VTSIHWSARVPETLAKMWCHPRSYLETAATGLTYAFETITISSDFTPISRHLGRFRDALRLCFGASPNPGLTQIQTKSGKQMPKSAHIAVLAAAFTAAYAIGPFAAHAKQIEHSLQRAAVVRTEATRIPGNWQITCNYHHDDDDDCFRIGAMGG